MQVVIEIPEDRYQVIKSARRVEFVVDTYTVGIAIANGTPLPKGHGDLKDQNEILTVLIKSAEAHCQNSREDALMGRVRQQILSCHTIIEADKCQDDCEHCDWVTCPLDEDKGEE